AGREAAPGWGPGASRRRDATRGPFPPARTVTGERPMRGLKPSLALGTVAIISLSLWAGAAADRPGAAMADAAGRFLDALDDQKRDTATFEFDDAERLNWHFIPREREGLPIKQMIPEE